MKIIKEEIHGGTIQKGWSNLYLMDREGETSEKIKTITYEDSFPLPFTFKEAVILEPGKTREGEPKPVEESTCMSAEVKFPFGFGSASGEMTLFVFYQRGESPVDAIMKAIGKKLAALEFSPKEEK